MLKGKLIGYCCASIQPHIMGPVALRYIELVRKHGLEISQPGLEPNKGLTWQMTKRRGDREVHKYVILWFHIDISFLIPIAWRSMEVSRLCTWKANNVRIFLYLE